jgi:hypothetical protein
MADDVIKLARGLDLPLQAATQTFAALGKRGSGKTYGTGRLVEEMLGAGVQVVILDAIGNWFGLRLKKDGKTPSEFRIPILGGHRGDVELLPDAGALVARTLVETGSSAVLDVSLFRKSGRKQFATDFAEELLHLKKTAAVKTRLFLVLEESQLYIPQRTQKGEERMLGAFEDLVKLGRNYGIGVALISQRPQAVNKDVLNQTEVLMVFQMAGRHERDAIEDWITEKDAGELVDLVEEIPSLDVGVAFIWSPSWLRIFKKTKILEKRTFDASATPDTDDVEAGSLKAIDLGELQAAMATVAERAAEDDPKKLRARIAELEASTTAADDSRDWDRAGEEARRNTAEVRVLELEAEVRGLEEELAHAIAVEASNRDKLSTYIEQVKARVDQAIHALNLDLEEPLVETLTPTARPAPRLFETTMAPRRSTGPALSRETRRDLDVALQRRPSVSPLLKANGERQANGIKSGARRMLDVLGAFPSGLSKRALSTLSGIVLGGTFSDYLSILRTRGLIEEVDGNVIKPSPAGAAIASPRRPSTREILELWSPKLKGGAKRMLDELMKATPRPLTKDDLSKRAGVALGGTFSDYLSMLRTKGLIDEEGTWIRPSEILYLRGLTKG